MFTKLSHGPNTLRVAVTAVTLLCGENSKLVVRRSSLVFLATVVVRSVGERIAKVSIEEIVVDCTFGVEFHSDKRENNDGEHRKK